MDKTDTEGSARWSMKWIFSHMMFLYLMYINLVIPIFYIYSLHVVFPDDMEKVFHLHIVKKLNNLSRLA